MIVTYSELYAQSKGNNTFSSTPDEMRTFLGVLLVSDYSSELRCYLHWTLADDAHNEAIASAFTRNRFEEIMKYIHLSDNAKLDVGDKMAKVRPFLSMKKVAGRQNTQDLVWGGGGGRGGPMVIDLISELQEKIGSSYHLTFDNLFTSYNFADCLTSKGIARIGTLRSN